jgi:hypothetical protein
MIFNIELIQRLHLRNCGGFFSEVGLPAHIFGSRRPRGTTFEFNYLLHFEAKVEYNLGDESEAQSMLTDEKTVIKDLMLGFL